jgi:hypothetical protein
MHLEKLYIKTPKALLILTVLRKRVVLSSRLNVSFRNAACKTCNECECRYTKSNNNFLFQFTPALELPGQQLYYSYPLARECSNDRESTKRTERHSEQTISISWNESLRKSDFGIEARRSVGTDLCGF